ncbi:protein neprosin-like [Bidens hawaiensis]|uniref:protein neprosin-like n=1 Tax=Bidens hawaiensis TaxID=980011 RepID=UPI00404B21FC
MGPYYGAKAYLNLWKPIVARNDTSMSQIWATSTDTAGIVNNVEAGWQGKASGCFNLQCSGFIQTSKDISLGTAFKPISRYNKEQYYISITIWIDRYNGHWWLKKRDEIVGFWPKSLFNTLRGKAYSIEYGGEVFYENSNIHPLTQMGSGHFPVEGFRKAAFASHLEVVDENNVAKDVENLNVYSNEPNCYGVKTGYGSNRKAYLYYGGPGYNPECLK